MSAFTQFRTANALPTRRVVHVSRAAPDLTMDDVQSLIFEARGFNLLNGITGVLTYDPRGFLHCIEGTEDAVEELLVQTYNDRRHCSIRTLQDDWRDACEFMAFHDVMGTMDAPVTTAMLAGLWRVRLTPPTIHLLDHGYATLSQALADDRELASGR